MQHVFDISCLDMHASGAKQRFLSLYSEIIKKNKKKNFLIIYTSFKDVKKYFNFPNVTFKKNKFGQHNYINKIISIIYIYFYIFFIRYKVITVEHFTLPFIKIRSCLNIFTIHDLRRLHFSNLFLLKIAYKFFFGYFLKRADNIIVVSHTIKREILSYFSKLKITVVYNTINLDLFNKITKKNLRSVKKKYNLPNEFILTVGHLEKRKNYLRLIRAIDILKKNNENVNLIIVGQNSDESENIYKLIKQLKLTSNIKIFSNLNDHEVRCFYKLSKLFVFPSMYEGFGIPIIESMASKLPMV